MAVISIGLSVEHKLALSEGINCGFVCNKQIAAIDDEFEANGNYYKIASIIKLPFNSDKTGLLNLVAIPSDDVYVHCISYIGYAPSLLQPEYKIILSKDKWDCEGDIGEVIQYNYDSTTSPKIKSTQNEERCLVTQDLINKIKELHDGGVRFNDISKAVNENIHFAWDLYNRPDRVRTVRKSSYEFVMGSDISNYENSEVLELDSKLNIEIHQLISNINSHGVSNQKISKMMGESASFISAFKLNKRRTIRIEQYNRLKSILESLEGSA